MSWETVVPLHLCYEGSWPPGWEEMDAGSVWKCDGCSRRLQLTGRLIGIPLWKNLPTAGETGGLER